MIRFSLVVPAYGSAKYLPRLFDSLAAQTFRDFEVLFAVEDSPDASLALCEEWAHARHYVQVGSLPCTGAAGASRNWCYARAAGEYIVPLDGDDWLEADALERLDRLIARTERPEVVLATAQVWYENDDGALVKGELLANLPASAEGEVMTGYELVRRVGRSGRHALNYAALTVVRTDYLREHDLRQRVGVCSEDSEWVPRVWLGATRIASLAYPYYNYRRHSGSVSNVPNSKILYSVSGLFVRLARYFGELDLPADVRHYVQNDAVSIFCWYLTNELYVHRFSDADRRAALSIVFGGNLDAACFRRVARSASLLKRLGLKLMILASATGWLSPMLWYFRKVYYPLTRLKHRQ